MTDFKITPEDVGRVAVDERNRSWFFIYANSSYSVFGMNANDAVAVFHLNGKPQDDAHWFALTHWRPRTLEAPKRWWNVYRGRDGEYNVFDHDTFEEATDIPPHSEPVARIYDHFWHGCEEGRFDEPEDYGCNCPVTAIPGGGGAYDPHENEEDCDNWGAPS